MSNRKVRDPVKHQMKAGNRLAGGSICLILMFIAAVGYVFVRDPLSLPPERFTVDGVIDYVMHGGISVQVGAGIVVGVVILSLIGIVWGARARR